MHCARVKLPGGGFAIVCGHRGRVHACGSCGAVAELQCDWKTGKGTTCDAWICATCAQEVGPDKHLCPTHQSTYKEWLARRDASSTQHSEVSTQDSTP